MKYLNNKPVWSSIFAMLLFFFSGCSKDEPAVASDVEVESKDDMMLLASSTDGPNRFQQDAAVEQSNTCMILPESVISPNTWLVATIDTYTLEQNMLAELSQVDEKKLTKEEQEALSNIRLKMGGLSASGLTGIFLGVNSVVHSGDIAKGGAAGLSSQTNTDPFLFIRSESKTSAERLVNALKGFEQVPADLSILADAEMSEELSILKPMMNKLGSAEASKFSDDLVLTRWSDGWWLADKPELFLPERQTKEYSGVMQKTLSVSGEPSLCVGFIMKPEIGEAFKAVSMQGMASMFFSDLSGPLEDLQYGSLSWYLKDQNERLSIAFSFSNEIQAAVFSNAMSGKVLMLRNFLGGAKSIQQMSGTKMSVQEAGIVDGMNLLLDQLKFKHNKLKSELHLGEDFFSTLGEIAMLESQVAPDSETSMTDSKH